MPLTWFATAFGAIMEGLSSPAHPMRQLEPPLSRTKVCCVDILYVHASPKIINTESYDYGHYLKFNRGH